MLSKPQHGWTDFQLEGLGAYGLSYLDDIAPEWLDQAIRGLETMQPFCVTGYLEPGRLLCTVSDWNCDIVIEEDWPGASEVYSSPTGMLDFCRALHGDISRHLEDWAAFGAGISRDGKSLAAKERLLKEKLDRLQGLIRRKAGCFDEVHRFL